MVIAIPNHISCFNFLTRTEFATVVLICNGLDNLAVTAPSRRRVYQFRHPGLYGFGFRVSSSWLKAKRDGGVTKFLDDQKRGTRNPKPVSRVIPPGLEPGTL